MVFPKPLSLDGRGQGEGEYLPPPLNLLPLGEEIHKEFCGEL